MKLIVGLGNPGEQYQNTRHNVGFMAIDEMIAKFKAENQNQNLKYKNNFNSELIFLDQLILAKPQTFMNLSGEAVSAICRYYKINSNQICVIHDDLDIQMGKFKFEYGRGPKIHNGVNSVESSLSTKDFWRVRIGVDNRTSEEKAQIKGSDYVLKKLTQDENHQVLNTLTHIIKTLQTEFLEKI